MDNSALARMYQETRIKNPLNLTQAYNLRRGEEREGRRTLEKKQMVVASPSLPLERWPPRPCHFCLAVQPCSALFLSNPRLLSTHECLSLTQGEDPLASKSAPNLAPLAAATPSHPCPQPLKPLTNVIFLPSCPHEGSKCQSAILFHLFHSS